MIDSILTSVKKYVGIPEEYTHFDEDLIVNINMAFAILNDIGVGDSSNFVISDAESVWKDFSDDDKTISLVKTYVQLKSKMLFDPPTASAVKEAMDRNISELEWRLNVIGDGG